MSDGHAWELAERKPGGRAHWRCLKCGRIVLTPNEREPDPDVPNWMLTGDLIRKTTCEESVAWTVLES